MDSDLLTGLIIVIAAIVGVSLLGIMAAAAARRRNGEIEAARNARIQAEAERDAADANHILAIATDSLTERLTIAGRGPRGFMRVERVIGEDILGRMTDVAERLGTGGNVSFERSRPGGNTRFSVSAPQQHSAHHYNVVADEAPIEGRRRPAPDGCGGCRNKNTNNITINGIPAGGVSSSTTTPQRTDPAPRPTTGGGTDPNPNPNPRPDTRGQQVKLVSAKVEKGEIKVGETTKITATLDNVAPAGGCKLTVTVSEATILEAPAEFVIEAGKKTAEVEVKASAVGESTVTIKLGTFGKTQMVKVVA